MAWGMSVAPALEKVWPSIASRLSRGRRRHDFCLNTCGAFNEAGKLMQIRRFAGVTEHDCLILMQSAAAPKGQSHDYDSPINPIKEARDGSRGWNVYFTCGSRARGCATPVERSS